jgi:glycosyltransferase involved in cell wall biosynthesis
MGRERSTSQNRLRDGVVKSVRPIRFCMLTTFYPPWHFGGDAIQVQRLAHALADVGHRVTVVHSPRVHRFLGGRMLGDRQEHTGVEPVPIDETLPSLVGTFLFGRPLRARRQLERLLARGFDVLHFHNPSLLGAPALFAMGSGIKLYTAHEQWLLCPSHVLWRRSGRVCDDPPCWSCELAHRRPPQLWRRTSSLLERSLGHLDALILPSRSSTRLHARFAAAARLEELEHFLPDPGGSDGAGERGAGADAPNVPHSVRPYFLYAGRLEPIKGVGTLIGAFQRRRSEDLVIAGVGSLDRRLRRAARGLAHVRFIGWLPSADLDLLYRNAIAVVVPSLGHESCPLVPLEAFARGTPAIVRRFGALADLAEDTGAALSFGSSDELDAAIARLAADDGLRRELGRRARTAYEQRFAPELHLRRYLSLIAALARERGNEELALAAEGPRNGLAGAGG